MQKKEQKKSVYSSCCVHLCPNALQLHQVAAIVAGGSGRDLVLTPKQTLQLNGKRLYYEEQPAGAADRSWEHTLKHVTYVTLFTDAAVGAAAGNLR